MRLIQALRRPVVRDAGLVLLLAWTSYELSGEPIAEVMFKYPTAEGLDAAWRTRVVWWWVVALPAVVALLLRRRRPAVALALAAASGLAHAFDRDLWPLPLDLAAAVGIYAVAAVAAGRRRSLLALGGLLAMLTLARLAARIGLGPPTLYELVKGGRAPVVWPEVLLTALTEAVAPALVLGVAWAVGDNARTRRLHLATLEQRAIDLQRERDHRAALAVAAERARITRELHDVVAHGISVMVVQAQGAAAALRNHPERTAGALEAIVQTGRASLAEMRRLLGVAQAGGGEAGRAPQPGLGALPGLIDQVREAGTPVTLTVDGDPSTLPTGVDLSAYRIVQEALTNVLKHAGPGAAATVRLAFRPGELEIGVTDDGTGEGRPTGEGNGLRGVTERARLLGGVVEAGSRPGGGFEVRARLPVEEGP